jgi:hypothetical protein
MRFLIFSAALVVATTALAAPAQSGSLDQLTFDSNHVVDLVNDASHRASDYVRHVAGKAEKWVTQGVRKFDEVTSNGINCMSL